MLTACDQINNFSACKADFRRRNVITSISDTLKVTIEEQISEKDIIKMIKILLVCHGNILKYPEKASKINDSTARKGNLLHRF